MGMNHSTARRLKDEEIKQDLKFALFSDSRPVDNEFYWNTVRSKLLLQHNVDFVINLGDFTKWSWPWEYRNYFSKIPSGSVMFHMIGNHDNRIFGNWLFKRYFGSWDFTLEYGRWVFVFARNAYVIKYGICPEQKKWLEQELERAHNKFQKVCIFTHVPPLSPFSTLDLPQEKLLEDSRYEKILGSSHAPELAFYGHAHLYAQRKENRTVHVISGGAALEEDLHDCPIDPPHTYRGQHATLVTVRQKGSFTIELMLPDGTIEPRYTRKG